MARFVDRVVQYPNRGKLTKLDGENQYLFEPDEGTVSTSGTALNATNLNAAMGQVIVGDTLYTLRTGSSGASGYITFVLE